tara:strand:- start:302 stop:904 length:603 start_codon:yes stop_codon:yes gene_type:complete
MEIVLLNTPPAYGQQIWVDNIKYMLDNAGRQYDVIHVMDDVVHGSVYDKLVLFDRFRKGQYLFFDLDIAITGPIVHLYTTKFTLLNAWWREPAHTPLNSSIMSWCGDHSHIYEKFNEDPDYYMVKYNKGIDEFIYHEVEYETYGKVCDTYAWGQCDMPITLYNHYRDELWKHECTLSVPEISTDPRLKNTLTQKYQMSIG